MHNLNFPFFFGTNNINETASEVDFCIIFILNCFARYSLKNFSFFVECLYKSPNNKVLFGMKGISWFQDSCFNNTSVAFFFSKSFDYC